MITAEGKPIVVDLFCKAGGATKGYQEAGFYVVGVDHHPQPRYVGDAFMQCDAFDFIDFYLSGGWQHMVAGVHASPPCQAWTDLQKQNKRVYAELIAPLRVLLESSGLPYVIENVEGAPLIEPLTLCGTMFPGLRVIRHRLFETNWSILGGADGQIEHPPHPTVFTHDKRKSHYGKLDQNESFVQVTGGGNATVANKRSAMGIDWMNGAELNEAIPPAYTKFIGEALMTMITRQEAT